MAGRGESAIAQQVRLTPMRLQDCQQAPSRLGRFSHGLVSTTPQKLIFLFAS